MSTSALRRYIFQEQAEKNIFRLKNCMPEKFEEIVLKHLANVTEMKIQDLDTQQRKKTPEKVTASFYRMSFKRKQVAKLTTETISTLSTLMEFIGKRKNITSEGLFRKTGNIGRQKIVRKHIINNLAIDFENLTPHDCANALKNFIRDLPEPLLTNGFRNVYIRLSSAITASDMSKTATTTALQLLMLLLPDNNYCLLKPLIALLHRSAKITENLMTASSLALMFTHHFLCSKSVSGTELQTITNTFTDLVAFMIEAGKDLFIVPQDLADEVSKFWNEMEIPNFLCLKSQKKNRPLKTLDDSVLVDSPATTPKTSARRSLVHIIDLAITPHKGRSGLFSSHTKISSDTSTDITNDNSGGKDVTADDKSEQTIFNIDKPVAVVKPTTRYPISQNFRSVPENIHNAMQTPMSRAHTQVQSPQQKSTDTFDSDEEIMV